MGLLQVFAICPLTLVKIGDRVEPHPVDTEAQPEVDDGEDRVPDRGVVKIQIGLMRVKTMPVICLRHRIPAPVRRLEVLEDHANVLVAIGRIAPDVEVALGASGRGPPSTLKPRVLVGRVIQHQLGDDSEPAVVGGFEKGPELVELAVLRMDVRVVCDVVPVVLEG